MTLHSHATVLPSANDNVRLPMRIRLEKHEIDLCVGTGLWEYFLGKVRV